MTRPVTDPKADPVSDRFTNAIHSICTEPFGTHRVNRGTMGSGPIIPAAKQRANMKTSSEMDGQPLRTLDWIVFKIAKDFVQ